MNTFYTANYLEESMSYIERTAKKLLPILEEVKKRMIPEKKLIDKQANAAIITTNNRKSFKGEVKTLESINDNISDDDNSMLDDDFDINNNLQ